MLYKNCQNFVKLPPQINHYGYPLSINYMTLYIYRVMVVTPVITSSKDQSIKLWDLRKFSSSRGEKATLDRVRMQMWGYCWENMPKRARQDAMSKLAGDISVMTDAGHTVKNTLWRCRFSPLFATGQVQE